MIWKTLCLCAEDVSRKLVRCTAEWSAENAATSHKNDDNHGEGDDDDEDEDDENEGETITLHGVDNITLSPFKENVVYIRGFVVRRLTSYKNNAIGCVVSKSALVSTEKPQSRVFQLM